MPKDLTRPRAMITNDLMARSEFPTQTLLLSLISSSLKSFERDETQIQTTL